VRRTAPLVAIGLALTCTGCGDASVDDTPAADRSAERSDDERADLEPRPDGSPSDGSQSDEAQPDEAQPDEAQPDEPPAPDPATQLAVLEPLPEFVEAERAAAPPGHLVAHGTLDRLAPPEAGGPLHATWALFDAPAYTEPALMESGERPALDAVLDPRLLAARGRRVVVDGFGTVEREANGRPVDLLVTPLPPACCLGRFPSATERVHARLPADCELDLDPWTPLRLVGTLVVEERRDGLGLFEGLYFLEVESIL